MDYNRPWYERRPNYYDVDRVSRTIELLATENDWNLPPTRKAFMHEQSIQHERWPMVEDFEVLFYGDRSNHVAAWVVVPRNCPTWMKKEFCVRISDTDFPLKPMSELSQTISNLDATFTRE